MGSSITGIIGEIVCLGFFVAFFLFHCSLDTAMVISSPGLHVVTVWLMSLCFAMPECRWLRRNEEERKQGRKLEQSTKENITHSLWDVGRACDISPLEGILLPHLRGGPIYKPPAGWVVCQFLLWRPVQHYSYKVMKRVGPLSSTSISDRTVAQPAAWMVRETLLAIYYYRSTAHWLVDW